MGYRVQVKDKVRAGDLVVLYSDPNNDFVAVPTALFLSKPSIDWKFYKPTATGFSYTVDKSEDNIHLIIENESTLASGTVVLPRNPLNNQEVTITAMATITSLTVSANTGDTIVYAAQSVSPSKALRFRYNITKYAWFIAG